MAKPDDTPVVLALNCGSSSLKFALVRIRAADVETLIEGEAEAIGAPQARFRAAIADGDPVSDSSPIADHGQAAELVFGLIAANDAFSPAAIGHRIVHGGPSVRRHCVITHQVQEALEAAGAFAPLHTPAALAVLRTARERFAAIPHVACLDTAFHRDLPDVARRLPIPAGLRSGGVERYGFHGLSCESVMRRLGPSAPDRLVIAHLGSGSSVTAVKAGRSIDTSMGLTPSGGVMMATRSGDLDPGLLVYLLREQGCDAERLERMIDREAGMLGVSGLSGDLRQLRAAPDNPDAQLALRMFVYSVRKQVAAMVAALEGLDLLVFTGGIGENDVQTRAEIRHGLSWLGIDPLDRSNARPRGGRAEVRAMPANEEEQIARHTAALVTPGNEPFASAGGAFS
jgi:acetate kinase